jgi:hypothetical protein
MALNFKEATAIAQLAEHLYDYLPGSGDPKWKGHVSFKTVAADVGVARFWQEGSKRPMIEALLGKTLEKERSYFQQLVLAIVRAGITYRAKKNNPITPDDIDILNGLILGVGFKFPELWDPDFHASLRMDSTSRAKERVEDAIQQERTRVSARSARAEHMDRLRQSFLALHSLRPQDAGFAFEKLLDALFSLEGLSPRGSFRIEGEQIDGSAMLDHETYLVEAKWEKEPLPEAPLLTFRGKIEGKSAFTRGLFIALNGISEPALGAITAGKQPTFFLINGHDMMMILEDNLSLPEFLRQRQRLLAEEGRVVVPYNELRKGSRR